MIYAVFFGYLTPNDSYTDIPCAVALHEMVFDVAGWRTDFLANGLRMVCFQCIYALGYALLYLERALCFWEILED